MIYTDVILHNKNHMQMVLAMNRVCLLLGITMICIPLLSRESVYAGEILIGIPHEMPEAISVEDWRVGIVEDQTFQSPSDLSK